MREQAQIAIDTADVILFMCDIRTGLLADDMDIAVMLKKSGKPVIPCINKSDRIGDVDANFYEFYELGFQIVATEGTARFLDENNIPNTEVKKLSEGRPNICDMIKNGDIQMIFNTPIGREGKTDDSYIRTMAIQNQVPYMTTIAAANATVIGIEAVLNKKGSELKSLQEYHQ
jgi:carbamoyl-phosphate synthase large subunit